MTTEPVSQTLRRAKQYLLDHGWSPDGPQTADGKVCAAYAIGYCQAYGNYKNYRTFAKAIPIVGTEDIHDVNLPINIGRWNDTPGRTFEEVLAAYDRAIALAEVEE